MQHPIRGLHHVTATADDAQADLDFSRGLLGLRLVKKTVNFDNHNVYHFYYGNERGEPGTIWTTFPYRGWGVATGVKGAGQVTVTSFSVPSDSLGFWAARLAEGGAPVREAAPRFGEEAITVQDPSGLVFELVGNGNDSRVPWAGSDIEDRAAIRGLHSVTLVVASSAPTIQLMTDVLGFRVVNEEGNRTRLSTAGDTAGRTIDVIADATAVIARNGLGTVHHVAMAIDTAEEQLRLRNELLRAGLRVTEVRDRQYFQSIYFREPGGVLFEVATIPPGFTVDEELDALGRELKLPPWEEPHRTDIERTLPKISAGAR